MLEVGEILRGNYWKIRKEEISKEILSFLSYFYYVKIKECFNEKGEIEEFYILEKKKKFLYN